MAEIKIKDPFDDPNFQEAKSASAAPPPSGLKIIDPYDDPSYLEAAKPNTQELLLQKPKEAMEIQPSLQAKLGTTDDLSEQARIFAQNKFPNMPLNEAMSRISRQGNRLVYLDTDGQAKYATPELFRSPIASGEGFALQNPINTDRLGTRLSQSLSNYSSRLPEEIATEAIDKKVGKFLPFGARQAVSGVVQGVTGYPRQVVGNILSDNPDPFTSVDPGETIRSISEGVLSSGFAQGLEKLAGKRNMLNLGRADANKLGDPAEIAKIRDRQAAFEENKITPTLSQVTDLDSQRVTERQLQRGTNELPKFTEIYRKQAEQISNRAEELVEQVGNPDSLASYRDLASTAKQIIVDAEDARAARAGGHYEDAFNSGKTPDIKETLSIIDSYLATIRGPSVGSRTDVAKDTVTETASGRGVNAFTELDKVRSLLANPRETIEPDGRRSLEFIPITDYRQLHSVKEQLDARILDIEEVGNSAEKRALGMLRTVRNNLNETLKATDDNYRIGAEKFAEDSIGIDELKKGKIGVLSKIDFSKGDIRPGVLDFMLKAKSNSREGMNEIIKIKKKIQSQPNGENVWNNATASWLSGILDEAEEVATQGTSANVSIASNLRKRLFKTKKQKMAIMNAVGGDRFKAFENFFKTLESVEKTLPVGSQTATDLGADFVGPVAKVTAKALQFRNIINPGELIEVISASMNRDRLAKLFTTPQGLRELDKFKLLKPATNASISLLARTLQSMTTGSLREYVEDENQVTRPEMPQ